MISAAIILHVPFFKMRFYIVDYFPRESLRRSGIYRVVFYTVLCFLQTNLFMNPQIRRS